MLKENGIQLTKLIIVEGNHERDFFSAWLDHLHITDTQILPIGGKTGLAGNLKPLAKQSNFSQVVSLVVIRDADDNPEGAFQSVCSALAGANLPVPALPEQFTNHDDRKVAIIVTPCRNRAGALEELLLETADADIIYPVTNDFINNAIDILARSHTRLVPPAHKQGKAKIHAFLATFEEPDKDPGKAALAGVWNFDHAALNPIREILEQM